MLLHINKVTDVKERPKPQYNNHYSFLFTYNILYIDMYITYNLNCTTTDNEIYIFKIINISITWLFEQLCSVSG